MSSISSEKTKRVALFFLPFLIFFAIDLITYRNGLIEIPQKDHHRYMIERGLVVNDWEWFWHTVSLNRTRYTFLGESFLHRPGLFGVLALEDIFLRDKLQAQGVISLLIHSLAAASLFLLARYLLGCGWAFFFSILFLLQYPGMTMILWHHITPYLLSLAFFNFGLGALCRYNTSKEKKYLYLTFVFSCTAVLFHEAIALTLCGVALVLLIINRRRHEFAGAFSRSIILKVFLLPAVLYVLWSLADYLYYRPFIPPTPASPAFPKIVFIAGLRILQFFTCMSLSFVFPFVINLVAYSSECYLVFENLKPSADLSILILSSFIIMAVLIIRVLRSAGANAGNNTLQNTNLVVISYLLLLVVFLLGSLGRSIRYGINYFLYSPYYYSLTGLIFCMLLAALLAQRKAAVAPVRFNRLLPGLIIIMGCSIILVNYVKIQKTLSAFAPIKTVFANNLKYVQTRLAASPQFCLACPDAGTAFVNNYQYYLLLWDRQCGLDGNKTPLYLSKAPNGRLTLAELKTNAWNSSSPSPLKFKAVPAESLGGGISPTALRPIDAPREIGMLFLTDAEHPTVNFEVAVSHCIHGGMVFGYKNPDNFQIFVLEKGWVYGRIKDQGVLSEPLNKSILPGRIAKTVTLRAVGNDAQVYLFGNGMLLTRFKPTNLKGRLGVFVLNYPEHPSSITSSQTFPPVTNEFGLIFTPRVSLDKFVIVP